MKVNYNDVKEIILKNGHVEFLTEYRDSNSVISNSVWYADRTMREQIEFEINTSKLSVVSR